MRHLFHCSRSLIVCALLSSTFMCLAQSQANPPANSEGGKKSSDCDGHAGKTMCTDDNGKTRHKASNDNDKGKKEPPDHPSQAEPAPPLSRPIYERLIPEFGRGDSSDKKTTLPRRAGNPPVDPSSLREIVASVSINDHLVDEFALLAEDEQGHLFAGADVISATRLGMRPVASAHFHGRDYYSLDSISGLTYKFDSRRQSLSISIASSQFAESVLAIPRPLLL